MPASKATMQLVLFDLISAGGASAQSFSSKSAFASVSPSVSENGSSARVWRQAATTSEVPAYPERGFIALLRPSSLFSALFIGDGNETRETVRLR
ncbi:hypothetical protein DFH06DRAFT_1216361 [Mycena polygramma]|nr:hypothetical protein DFH06DRAFT_1216361 [Mycena polygramma]